MGEISRRLRSESEASLQCSDPPGGERGWEWKVKNWTPYTSRHHPRASFSPPPASGSNASTSQNGSLCRCEIRAPILPPQIPRPEKKLQKQEGKIERRISNTKDCESNLDNDFGPVLAVF